MDPISMLKGDHRKVKYLFRRFEGAQGTEKEELFKEIMKELQVHTKIEEELFYPEIKKIDSEIAAEALEEHNIVDFILASMKKLSPDDESYDAKFKTLRENVEHHIEEEEGEMFPKAEGSLGNMEDLGRRMMARKEKLMKSASSRSRSSASRSASRSRTTSGSRSQSKSRS